MKRQVPVLLIVASLLLTAVLTFYEERAPRARSDPREAARVEVPAEEAGTACRDADDEVEYYRTLEAQLLAGWYDDLFLQPRLLAYARAASAYGFAAGTTPWRALPLDEEQHRWAGFASPSELLAAFAQEHVAMSLGTEEFEAVTRLQIDDDKALGALLLWGYRDDALAGRDYKLEMLRDATGWRLVVLEERYHCRRGVSETGLCL